MQTDSSVSAARSTREDYRVQRFAMGLSLVVGIGMFLGKGTAYVLTGSAAVLSDAAESVVHVAAVAFAVYSLWLSHQPPDRNHLYGHEKIDYFSAGFEGGMIALAALFILYESISSWIIGLSVQRIGIGIIVVVATTAINGVLGMYLVRTGKRRHSLILIANGKHVLTDSWTSLGALAALVLVKLTGRLEFDPIIAILIALNILWSGSRLIATSFRGLMDEADRETDEQLRSVLDRWQRSSGGRYHELRHRMSGSVLWVEVHLLFPGGGTLEETHAATTALEREMEQRLAVPRVMITTHLEPLEKHGQHHPEELGG